MRLLSILLIVLVLVAACDATALPTLPPITVVITAVDDTEALGNAVAQALTETAQVNMRATETVLAQGGITLTPSLTPTLMPTLPPRPTRESSPTATFTPSVTPTPTFAPYLTNTPASVPAETAAWVRVIHVWRGTELAPNSPFDVSINGETISRGLTFGQQTNFQQVTPGAVEIILRETVTVDGPPVPPRFSEVMQVAPGENLSLVIAKSGLDVMLIPVREDAAALADGTSRLTLVQANPQLFPALVVMPDLRRLLASALQTGQIIGPIDVPSGSNYVIDLYDASNPEALLASLPLLSLENRVSYLAILVPAAAEDEFTNVYVFAGSTRLLADEVYARFINVATNTGALKVTLNEQTQFERLTTGVSDVIPLSVQGVRMNLTNEAGQMVNSVVLGPWAAEGERMSDKIIVLYDNPAETRIPVGAIAYSMNAPRSAINANVRLVHVLPGVIPLDLQVRARVIQPAAIGTTATPTPLPEEANPWVKIAEAEYLAVSGYAARVPQTYDVRVVLSGTRNVLAELSLVSLRPGASYDFVVLPGTEANSAQLVLLQPRAQMAAEQGSPSAIAEAVAATLTAVAPISTATPTRASSPTPTRTPLPTNTPRPSNTPSFLPPSLAVEPAPPDAARGSLVLTGQGFLPNRVYSIYFDNALEPTQTGVTTEDGSVLVVVNLPDLSPGLHTLRLCSGTCPGSGIEAVAVVRIALPNQTPTATPQP